MYGEHPYLPSGSFITGGYDGTVRIWRTERGEEEGEGEETATVQKKVFFMFSVSIV